MTEIPAKTPRPIGSTDNFFPGRVNVAAGSVVSAAAADPAMFEEEAGAALEGSAALLSGPVDPDWLGVGIGAGALVAASVVLEEAPLTGIVGIPEGDADTELPPALAEGVGEAGAGVELGTVPPLAAEVEETGGGTAGGGAELEAAGAGTEAGAEFEGGAELAPVDWFALFTVIVHCFTSTTAGWPLSSVMGVKVTTHVCTAPLDVVSTVVNDIEL